MRQGLDWAATRVARRPSPFIFSFLPPYPTADASETLNSHQEDGAEKSTPEKYRPLYPAYGFPARERHRYVPAVNAGSIVTCAVALFEKPDALADPASDQSPVIGSSRCHAKSASRS